MKMLNFIKTKLKEVKILKKIYFKLKFYLPFGDCEHKKQQKQLFVLENPKEDTLYSITSFSGWYFTRDAREKKLLLYLNDTPYVELQYGLNRWDIGQVFSENKESICSGFLGDIIFPDTIKPYDEIDIKIINIKNNHEILFHKKFKAPLDSEIITERTKTFTIENLLSLEITQLSHNSSEKNTKIEVDKNIYCRNNVFHFLEKEQLPVIKVTQEGTTHIYSQDALQIIEKFKDGVVLDFGAGNTPSNCLRNNICYLDVHQYRHTDIVCTTSKLPFKDNSFDAIISQAVFEHIPNPFVTAKEFYRILKPGGIVHIDTAFMQPLHGDPSHYFNMTLHALQLVMSDFERIRSGIKEYQYPSYGLIMSLEAVLPYTRSGKWKHRLQKLHRQLQKEGDKLDRDLGDKGREIIAAGVFFEGRKHFK